MDNFEKVEKLREHANVTYEEAKEALENSNWKRGTQEQFQGFHASVRQMVQSYSGHGQFQQLLCRERRQGNIQNPNHCIGIASALRILGSTPIAYHWFIPEYAISFSGTGYACCRSGY